MADGRGEAVFAGACLGLVRSDDVQVSALAGGVPAILG